MGGTAVNLHQLQDQMQRIAAMAKAKQVATAIEHDDWAKAARLLGMTDDLVKDMDVATFIDALKVRFADLLRRAGVPG